MSTYNDRKAGTIGHMASFSFENTKHLSCGEGGIVTTADPELAKMVRKVGGNGFKNLQAEEGRIRLNADAFQNPDYKRHDELGWNYRLPEFNAAIALAQLESADDLINLRIKSDEGYPVCISDSESEIAKTYFIIAENIHSKIIKHSFSP